MPTDCMRKRNMPDSTPKHAQQFKRRSMAPIQPEKKREPEVVKQPARTSVRVTLTLFLIKVTSPFIVNLSRNVFAAASLSSLLGGP